MDNFTIRPAEPKDAGDYTDWLKGSSDINLVDWNVYGYPAINTLVVEQEAEPVLMTSAHPVLTVEALAPKPGLKPKDEARALKKLFEGLRNLAIASGIAEINFTCSDERVIRFAEKHGLKRVTTPILKMVVNTSSDPFYDGS